MAKKKSAKAGSKAKTKVGKGSVSVGELQSRHMRLTQEFDRLSTMVARQGQLLQGVYLVLQQAKLMPYAPEVATLPAQKPYTGLEPGKPIKTGFSKSLEGKPEAPKFSKPASQVGGDKKISSMAAAMFPSGNTTAPRSYDAVLRRNGQTLGYLTSEGTWTLDPKQIKMWTVYEDAQAMLGKAAVPEGAKAEIRGHN